MTKEEYEATIQDRTLPGVRIQAHEFTTLPHNLVPASKVAEQVPLSEERIEELAEAGYMPCWIIDGNVRLYQVGAVKRYVTRNLVSIQEGSTFPAIIPVSQKSAAEAHFERLPAELAYLADDLCAIVTDQPGVYFLISGKEVVYVGQSYNVGARVAAHRADPAKDFDFAVFMPIPASQLLRVETAFIRALRPRLNQTHRPNQAEDEAAREFLRSTFGGES
jgi:hypothetical protein